MDNLRFILFLFLGFSLFQLWEAWQNDYGPKQEIPVEEQIGVQGYNNLPEDLPEHADTRTQLTKPKDKDQDVVEQETELTIEERISVITDVIRAEIDTSGNLIVLDLIDYPVSLDKPNEPLGLLNNTEQHWFIAQSGLLGSAGSAPNHTSIFKFDKKTYQLEDGEDTLRVPLFWTNDKSIFVTKTFVFKKGSYLIELEQTVENQSDKNWLGAQYGQLQRNEKTENGSTFIRTYTGAVIYSEENKYEKIDFDDIMGENLDREIVGGWLAMIQHYFLAAWIPPHNEENEYYTKYLKDKHRFVIGYMSPKSDIAPGNEDVFRSRLFAGPKIQKIMEAISPGLELTVDYGFLTFIGKPIFWLLEKFHSYVHNWGFAIILVTIVIKALFFKLSEASYRSMAKMRGLQPKLQALKERYEDDKPRFNQEMMALYRTEKVNPLGGCLPILVQIPVFISLYWVLIETVELRQAPFILWIHDLSIKDPFFILPLLMGLSMWIQQQLNPTPVDPVQEKVMKLFPIIFTVFFLFFPAGLVLYWVVNNTLSIIQQWYITRQIEKKANA